MPGPFPYRSGFGFGRSPAPVCDVVISWGGQSKPLEALIDSGASGTVIPDSLAIELNLRKIGEERARGYSEQVQVHNRYVADINFYGLMLRRYPVVGVPNRTTGIIGRDILNRYVTTLHGPRLEFSLA